MHYRKAPMLAPARALALLLLTALLLAACGGETPATPTAPVQAPAETASGPAPTTDAIPAPTDTTEASTSSGEAIDLASLDPCTFVPQAEIAGIFGPLKDAGTVDTALGLEKGCTFYNEDGNFVSLTVHPADMWDLRKNLEADTEPVSGLGDEAFGVDKSDAYDLFVLVRDVAMLEVRVSTHDQTQARQLAESMIAQLP